MATARLGSNAWGTRRARLPGAHRPAPAVERPGRGRRPGRSRAARPGGGAGGSHSL